jgi:hypothetical protein
LALIILASLIVSSIGSPSAAFGTNTPLLAIDTDLGNGVCSPVDASRTISESAQVSVALCLLNSSSSPLDGVLSIARLSVSYDSPLVGSSVASDLTRDIDSNPDWNEDVSPGGHGTAIP